MNQLVDRKNSLMVQKGGIKRTMMDVTEKKRILEDLIEKLELEEGNFQTLNAKLDAVQASVEAKGTAEETLLKQIDDIQASIRTATNETTRLKLKCEERAKGELEARQAIQDRLDTVQRFFEARLDEIRSQLKVDEQKLELEIEVSFQNCLYKCNY